MTWPVTDYMACDRFVLLPSHEAYLSYDLPACYKTSSLVENMKTVKLSYDLSACYETSRLVDNIQTVKWQMLSL